MFYQSEGSTPADEIQRQLLLVVGGEDPQELLTLIDQQLLVCEREISQVPDRVQQTGPELAQRLAAPMQRALDALSHYQRWLSGLQQAIDDHSAVVAAHEEGQTVVPELTSALEEFAQAFAGAGTFQTPWANALNRLAQAILSGQAAEPSWDEYIAQFQKDFGKKLEEIRAINLPGRNLCLDSYLQVSETLAGLQASETLEGLNEPLQTLDEAIVGALKIETLMSQGVEGPAPIPATNVIVSIVRKGLAGELDKTLVSAFIDDYRELLDSFWEAFEKSMSKPVDSALVKDEIPRTLEYGDAHDAAAEALGQAYKNDDRPAVEKALEEILATASRLDESREVFATAAQHQSSAHCPACGRANPPENRRCEACGQQLSTEGQLSSSFNMMSGPALEDNQQLEMTENVARLFHACDDVAAGNITPAQFEAELANAAVGLRDFAQELSEIADETSDDSTMSEEMRKIWREEHLPYVHEAGAALTEGVNQCEAGLAEMASYLVDSQESHLIDGVRMVWEGLGTVHRARLSMNANLKMLEDVLGEAREKGLLTQES